jgi:Zn-dependent protease
MRWSFRLGHIYGVPIEVHWLFAALVGWAAFQGWGQATAPTNFFLQVVDWLTTTRVSWTHVAATLTAGVQGAAAGVLVLLLVFVCVLIHELGHTVHAQALGIPVRRIVLLPIGGLAQLARLPENPRDELRVAAAGPAANFALALMLGALAALWVLAEPNTLPLALRLRGALQTATPSLFGLLVYLTFANLGLALFNLLPAFPMDGGRILRSLLAMFLPRLAATRVVTWIGWLIGVLLTLMGLGLARSMGISASVGTVVVGLFTLAGAGLEESLERTRLILQQIPAGQAVRQPTWTLAPTDRLTPALVKSVFGLDRSVLPVVVGARLVGVLHQKDLRAWPGRGGDFSVAHLMKTQFAYVRADENLWHAQQLLAGSGVNALPVVDGESLHGMLTLADLRAARRDPETFLSKREGPILITGGNPTV